MSVAPRRRHHAAAIAVLLVAGLLAVGFTARGDEARAEQAAAAVAEPVLPPGFRDEVVLGEGHDQLLDQPTAAEEADDGRVLVLQKDGRLKLFDSFSDTTSVTVLDLQQQVHNYVDRGALGMTIDPDFASNGYVYVLFSYNYRLGDDPSTVPRWNGAGSPNYDDCPTEATGCAIGNRLLRVKVVGEQVTEQKVLITDWCQQYFSHSAGALEFDDEGYLYASAGEGARYENNESYDVGQYGNPCGDPMPAGNEQGGRLRAQDVRTLADPTGLSGSVIRVDPATGAPAPGNPLSADAGADTNAKRIVAHGFRNPFRMAVRPGTGDLYVGDVGESAFEEINRVGTNRSQLVNAGWPCFEGPNRYPDIARLPICGDLAPSAVTSPVFKYAHTEEVAYEEDCQQDTGSVSALELAQDPAFPTGLAGGLVFGDYARDCIWYLPRGGDGLPDAFNPQILVEHAATPVDLFTGKDGELYYVDLGLGEDYENLGGSIHRISFDGGRPVARLKLAAGSQNHGPTPLTATFDASDSSAPNPQDVLTYQWDLDGNGSFETSTGETPTRSTTYTNPDNNVTVTVRVSDGTNTDDRQLTVYPGNSPPVPTMTEPTAWHQWQVGEAFDFAGTATDPQDGTLPASAFSWSFTLEHCPGDCHSHPLYPADAPAAARSARSTTSCRATSWPG